MTLWWAKGRKALADVPTEVRKVPTTAPRVMTRISGTAVPRKTQPTMAFLEAFAGQVAGVVVAAFGPPEPAQGDGEGQAHHVGLPAGAVG